MDGGSRPQCFSLIVGLGAFATAVFAPLANAQALTDETPVRNLFGDVGILDMPSARMAPDGQLAFTFGDLGKKQHYGLDFQALPWLETSFRFSRIGVKYYDRSFGLKVRLLSETASLPDLSLGVRDIMGTGQYGAEYLVATKRIGDFDFTGGLGWGRLADRAIMPNPFGLIFSSFKSRPGFDFSGTGQLNFGRFFHGKNVGAFGGIVWQTPIDDLRVLAEYSSDEYTFEKNKPGSPHFVVRSPLNLGLQYRPFSSMTVSAGWFYGTTYGLTISIIGDTKEDYPSALRIGPKPPPPTLRTDEEQRTALKVMLSNNDRVRSQKAGGPWVDVRTPDATRQEILEAFLGISTNVRDVEVSKSALIVDAGTSTDLPAQCAAYAQIASSVDPSIRTLAVTDTDSSDGSVTLCSASKPVQPAMVQSATVVHPAAERSVEDAVRTDLASQYIGLDALSEGSGELSVYIDNYHYRSEAEAIGRVARVLMADAPAPIEVFHIIPVKLGVPLQEVTVARSALERNAEFSGTAAEFGEALSVTDAPADTSLLSDKFYDAYPQFWWSVDPKLTQQVFDPDKPIQFRIYAEADAALTIAEGLTVQADLTGTLWTDYTFGRPPGSKLPHVRTDLLKYIHDGAYGISSLKLMYVTRLTPEVIADAQVGYLEDMYMGAGSQVLWHPDHSRFAFGVDAYQIWKRDYNRLFGIQDYHVFTGHASVYYASPWYGLNFAVHAGRYLAGDYGGTFEITRELLTGVEIGAWATFTNVPFHKFGEGSFDKGIIVRIPLEWGLPISSQSSYDLHLASLTRDGGQRLAGDDVLYQMTRGADFSEISDHLNQVVAP